MSNDELQQAWRKRLAAAEQEYHQSSDELRLALQDAHRETPPEVIPEIMALQQRKAAARADYLAILRKFTDLVLRGKTPLAE